MNRYKFAIIFVLLFAVFCNGQSIGVENLRQEAQLTQKKPDLMGRMLAMDKLKHFTFSLYTTTTGYYIMNRMLETEYKQAYLYSAGFSLTLGLGKEGHDLKNDQGTFSFLDIVADLAGTAFGILIIDRIDNG